MSTDIALPLELWTRIASFLPAPSRVFLAATCKVMHSLVTTSPSVWHTLEITPATIKAYPEFNWKSLLIVKIGEIPGFVRILPQETKRGVRILVLDGLTVHFPVLQKAFNELRQIRVLSLCNCRFITVDQLAWFFKSYNPNCAPHLTHLYLQDVIVTTRRNTHRRTIARLRASLNPSTPLFLDLELSTGCSHNRTIKALSYACRVCSAPVPHAPPAVVSPTPPAPSASRASSARPANCAPDARSAHASVALNAFDMLSVLAPGARLLLREEVRRPRLRGRAQHLHAVRYLLCLDLPQGVGPHWGGEGAKVLNWPLEMLAKWSDESEMTEVDENEGNYEDVMDLNVPYISFFEHEEELTETEELTGIDENEVFFEHDEETEEIDENEVFFEHDEETEEIDENEIFFEHVEETEALTDIDENEVFFEHDETEELAKAKEMTETEALAETEELTETDETDETRN
ncbi:hypothetical protein BC938DRAFT_474095 [Jimgerdemannia flammicorona]|uniref:F-box domain-containing protein n=1 Tax=Jimgerdemannia flammicorona TaxID=994334 RepID=A0A433Q2W6_9FUNG|nr:hypothetical protein BC938DRAFT_474095 [Jimgerdemannia flammicorona]